MTVASDLADPLEENIYSSDSEMPAKRRRLPHGAAVVKIFCVHADPNFALPWTVKHQGSSTSTGFIFEDELNRLILTNAHAVQNAAVVQVRLRGAEEKFVAKILCVGEECDLALLTVESEEFWEQLGDTPLISLRQSIPRLKETVTVVGYPIGGDNTCITQGVVSRVDLQEYSHGANRLLAIQIDAAINPGNSGGPALDSSRRCVGVAFQSLKDGETENIGYIIPTEIVRHFLEDFKRHGRYKGFGDAGFNFQKLENRGMRKALGLTAGEGGVLIRKVAGASPANGIVLAGDVLLSVDRQAVSGDGTVSFREGERIPFSYLFNKKYVGEKCTVVVKRGNELLALSIGMIKFHPLVPADPLAPPEYLIVGGLVFVALSEPFLRCAVGEHFETEAPVRLLQLWGEGVRERPAQQAVILAQVLASELTVGFHEMRDLPLKSFNGTGIYDLASLANLIDSNSSEWLEFAFVGGDRIILNASEVIAASEGILQRNFIPASKRIHKEL